MVYASTNLVDWLPIFTNPASPAQFDCLDPEATNQPLRFYKVSEQRCAHANVSSVVSPMQKAKQRDQQTLLTPAAD